jgi:NAD(P)-dependent dehydrogenase (short-subunit alcohol dehydrogenase family)
MNKKVLLVTGGASGIGLAILKKFLYTGKWVAISFSRSKQKIMQAIEELKPISDDYLFLQGDVSNEGEVAQLYQEILDQYGRLDGLVNSAGIIYPGGIGDLSVEEWRKSIDINLTGTYLVTKKLLPLLKKSSYPSIVNISSISSKTLGGSLAYSVSKAGMDILTQGLARELAKYGIRVNSVNPGLVRSGFQVANGMMDEEEYNQFLSNADQQYPLGIGEPEDVANLVYFLMSPEAKWMTGSVVMLDGGKLISR